MFIRLGEHLRLIFLFRIIINIINSEEVHPNLPLLCEDPVSQQPPLLPHLLTFFVGKMVNNRTSNNNNSNNTCTRLLHHNPTHILPWEEDWVNQIVMSIWASDSNCFSIFLFHFEL
jgi:hypothetical protein